MSTLHTSTSSLPAGAALALAPIPDLPGQTFLFTNDTPQAAAERRLFGRFRLERVRDAFAGGDAGRKARDRWVDTLAPELVSADEAGEIWISGAAILPHNARVPGRPLYAALQIYQPAPLTAELIDHGTRRQRDAHFKRDQARREWTEFRRLRPHLAVKPCFAAFVAAHGQELKELGAPLSWSCFAEMLRRLENGEPVTRYHGRCGRPRNPELTPEQQAVANTAYLRERASVAGTLDAVQAQAELAGLPLPSRRAVQRYIDSISHAERVLAREGQKAFDSKILPRVRRDYGRLRPFGVVAVDGVVTPFTVQRVTSRGVSEAKATIVVFLDMASRYVLDLEIMVAERWENVSAPLMRIFYEQAIFEILYCDCGSGFAAIFGNSWRDRLGQLLKLAGAGLTNSIPGNPQSRGVIERFNRTLKSFFVAFAANWPAGGARPTADDLRRALATWLLAYHGRVHTGDGMAGRSPAQVMDEFRRSGEFASLSRLDGDTAQFGRARFVERTVGKNGVSIDGVYFGHFDHAVSRLAGRKVFCRLDADDAGVVCLCDEELRPLIDERTGEPIMATSRMLRGATRDELREAMSEQRRLAKAARTALDARPFLLGSRESQVVQIRAKRAAERRKAEHAALGEPATAAPNIKLTPATGAAQGAARRKRALVGGGGMQGGAAAAQSGFAALAERQEREGRTGGPEREPNFWAELAERGITADEECGEREASPWAALADGMDAAAAG